MVGGHGVLRIPGAGMIVVGEDQYRYGSKSGNTLVLTSPLTTEIDAGTEVTLVTPRCDADMQVEDPGTAGLDPDDVNRAISARTRLVVLAHASNVTGTLQDGTKVSGSFTC